MYCGICGKRNENRAFDGSHFVYKLDGTPIESHPCGHLAQFAVDILNEHERKNGRPDLFTIVDRSKTAV